MNILKGIVWHFEETHLFVFLLSYMRKSIPTNVLKLKLKLCILLSFCFITNVLEYRANTKQLCHFSSTHWLRCVTVTCKTFGCLEPVPSPRHQLSKLNPPSSFSFSSRMKLSDGCRKMSSLAVARPTMPPPTTAKSYVLEYRRQARLQTVQSRDAADNQPALHVAKGRKQSRKVRSAVQRPAVHDCMSN